jgi:hypothetical protein
MYVSVWTDGSIFFKNTLAYSGENILLASNVEDPDPHHLGTRILIKSNSGFESASGSASNKYQDPDPHQSDKSQSASR